MKPRRTPFSNTVFTLPGATEDSDLWAQRARDEAGPYIASVWEPNHDERHALAEGANLELRIFGDAHPPVMLAITDVPLGKASTRDG